MAELLTIVAPRRPSRKRAKGGKVATKSGRAQG